MGGPGREHGEAARAQHGTALLKADAQTFADRRGHSSRVTRRAVPHSCAPWLLERVVEQLASRRDGTGGPWHPKPLVGLAQPRSRRPVEAADATGDDIAGHEPINAFAAPNDSTRACSRGSRLTHYVQASTCSACDRPAACRTFSASSRSLRRSRTPGP